MENKKIRHHDITLRLEPEDGNLHAIDVIDIGGTGELSFYLGNRFDVLSVEQDKRKLDWEVKNKENLTTRYGVDAWDNKVPLKIGWEGSLDSFEGYRVCIIKKDLVELSGFCWWFPTLEPQSQFERFTYDLEIELPNHWNIVTPGEEIKNHSRFRYPQEIEDIFLCASPLLKLFQKECCDVNLKLYIPKSLIKFSETLIDDFSSSIELCTDLFGGLKEGNGGIGVISPRGKGGAEWGFERDGLWVVGEAFAKYLIDNDWKVNELSKSLSLHETIHGWFGIGVEFNEPWLAEAITQYLEVILTSMMYEDQDIAKKYFEHYRDRIEKHSVEEDKPIKDYCFLDNMYTHWYLKGSWAFWDLEATVGRNDLLELFRKIYQNNIDETITYQNFKRTLENTFEIESKFMEHWFEKKGFDPWFRGS